VKGSTRTIVCSSKTTFRLPFTSLGASTVLSRNTVTSSVSPCHGATHPLCQSASTLLHRHHSDHLVVPTVNCRWRDFSAAVPHIWNTLLMTSLQSLSTFLRLLRTFLFQKSFPDISGPEVLFQDLRHDKICGWWWW